MYNLEQELGREKFDNLIHDYYNQWKFKHPYPEDMKAVFQKDAGKDMTPEFDLLKKKESL
jgi:aminopeptidase N